MKLPDPIATAREIVAARFPDAVQAWLGGSAHTDRRTATSDLDITVLLGAGEAHRESLTYAGWPGELFVHTEGSARHYLAKDLGRRRPTMARLVAEGLSLLAGGGGDELRVLCRGARDRTTAVVRGRAAPQALSPY